MKHKIEFESKKFKKCEWLNKTLNVWRKKEVKHE